MMVLRAQQNIAMHNGIPWKNRGPTSGPYSALCDLNDVTKWRGQKFRARKGHEQGGRRGNSGGQHKWFFNEIRSVQNQQWVTYRQAYNIATAKYGGDPRYASWS